jgi:general secretion pathway protein I
MGYFCLPLRSTAGFGLLEAIVALALFAGAGMALFAWINANLTTAARLRENEAITRATWLASEWIETINPADPGQSDVELTEGVRLSWQSQPLTPQTKLMPLPGGISTPFKLALFQIVMKIQAPGLTSELELTRTRLGVWREPLLVIPDVL